MAIVDVNTAMQMKHRITGAGFGGVAAVIDVTSLTMIEHGAYAAYSTLHF